MKYTPHPGTDGQVTYVECAPNLWLPERIEVNGPAPGLEEETEAMSRFGQGFRVRAMLELYPYVLRYMRTSVELYIHRDENIETSTRYDIDTVNYRALKLEGLETGLAEAAPKTEDELDSTVGKWIALPRKDLGPAPDAELVSAARAYVKGRISGGRPHKAVAQELCVSTATAGRRATAAMKAGYLPTIFISRSNA